MTKEQLRNKIIKSLTAQGFYVNGHVSPSSFSKSHFRKLQSHSRKEQISLQNNFLTKNTDTVSEYIIDGKNLDPSKIELELRLVEEGSLEHILYRWWNLMWWSVPHQRAYGRQMRILLWDKGHNAPFGLIGLQSPILKMSVRDNHLNIPKSELDYVINKSMQAQRLGALPPYNQILGGKMAALTLTSNELRNLYCKKYKGVETIIEKRIIEPQLLFLTTTSAFGKSSIYNRLVYKDDLVGYSLGYTKGSGTFHISEELYSEIQKFLKKRKIDINTTFGYGPSRKMRLIDTALSLIDLPEYHYHNIQREFFLFPVAKNLKNVIERGVKPIYYQRKIDDLTNFWKERWALPRSQRMTDWKDFDGKKFLVSAKRNITRWSK
jgi:hypothetical protein